MDILRYILNRAAFRLDGMTVYTSERAYDIAPVVYAALAATVLLVWQRRRDLRLAFWALVFGYYLIILLRATLFPIHVSGAYADDLRTLPLFTWVYLHPRDIARGGILWEHWPGLLLNIFLTFPIGFLVPFVVQLTPKRAALLAIGTGVAIEAAQFLGTLLLRHPYREVDLYDVVMNALGVLIGYAFYRLAVALLPTPVVSGLR